MLSCINVFKFIFQTTKMSITQIVEGNFWVFDIGLTAFNINWKPQLWWFTDVDKSQTSSDWHHQNDTISNVACILWTLRTARTLFRIFDPIFFYGLSCFVNRWKKLALTDLARFQILHVKEKWRLNSEMSNEREKDCFVQFDVCCKFVQN